MYSSISNYEQKLYLDGVSVSGAVNINGSYSINYQPINTIGVGYNKMVFGEVPVAQFKISKNLLYNEPLLNYTGEGADKKAAPIRGTLSYNGKSLGFPSGYLTNFSLQCSVGQVPQTEFGIQVFGDLGSGYSYIDGTTSTPYISVPQVKDISLTCSGSSTNRIKQFNYEINCPKKPIYLQGGDSYKPYEVLSTLPLEVNASFVMEVDDFQTRNLYDQITSDSDSSFSISIKGTLFSDKSLNVGGRTLYGNGVVISVGKKADGVNIFNTSLNNVKLISQEYSSTTDDFLSVRLSYKGYLN